MLFNTADMLVDRASSFMSIQKITFTTCMCSLQPHWLSFTVCVSQCKFARPLLVNRQANGNGETNKNVHRLK